jgi:hypothetical protein
VTIGACGGVASTSGSSAPGAAPPADRLACAGDARVESLARDARPASDDVVTDGAFVYWLRKGSDTGGDQPAPQIVRAPVGGGPIEILASGVEAQRIAIDATHVYWTARVLADGDVNVARVLKTGGAIEPVIPKSVETRWSDGTTSTEDYDEAGAIALDGDAVVWVGRILVGGGGLALLRAPKSGGPVVRIAETEDPYVATVVTLGDRVYWIEPGLHSSRDAFLRSAPRLGGDGGPGAIVAHGDTFRTPDDTRRIDTCLASDGASLYWGSHHDGTVVRIDPGGGLTTLASDQHDFVSLAVGGGFVYWSWSHESSEGAVARVPTTGGAVTIVRDHTWPEGVAYDPGGLLVTTSDGLERVTTCP